MDTSAEPIDERELILQTACVLHANGQSTAMTLVAVDRLNRGLGSAATLIPTWDAVFVRDTHTDRPMQLVAAQPIDMNMRRVAAVMRTVDDIERGVAGSRELRAVLSAAANVPPARTPVFVVACAAGAAGLSLVYGAPHWSVVAMVAAVAGLGGLVRRALLRAGVGILGQSFAAALVAGIAGVVASRLDPHTALGLVAICPAIVLVPGPHILMGAMDLLGLRVALGVARLSYAMLVLSAIAAGLIVGLGVGGQSLQLDSPGPHDALLADVVGAAIAAACFPIFYSMPYRFIVWPVTVGATAHALHWWVLNVAHGSLGTAALVSCAFVGIVLGAVAYFHRFPFAAVGFAAVVALVPGIYVFRALAGLVQLPSKASSTVISAIAADGATAAVVVACMAVGLTVPTGIRDALIARRERQSKSPWHAGHVATPMTVHPNTGAHPGRGSPGLSAGPAIAADECEDHS
ncbi:MAG: threonine/serine exporter family protein [Mycobacterium sp.]